MSNGTRYTPSGPDAEAAIEVEIPVPAGTVCLRIPYSAFAPAFRTLSDGREDMFRTFNNQKLGIWPKLSRKIPLLNGGDVYTVTADDLGWGQKSAPARSATTDLVAN
jgi:hypothetical protein